MTSRIAAVRANGCGLALREPDLGKAGLTGKISWRTASGDLSATPPPLPTKPAVVASGLSPNALEQAPQLVFDEFNRARLAALEAAEQQAKPIALRAKVGLRRAGTRISSIREYAANVLGGDWDVLTVVEGVTGPEIVRQSSHELDKVLRPNRKLPPELEGMARLHVFGPIFGDETLAGLAYAPHEAANLLQKDTFEAFARWDAKRAGALNVKAGTPVRVSQYVKRRPVGFKKEPFVRVVRYDFTLENGA